ncbi:MAG: hypothetical protein CVV52_00620 [Spirochaetae bacterium HGW-Spirochaetae-8]|nr:MAG: hypothetical protein CVV52_00620 [Spirochaetae bacterium HGW-Spirochaetae-8]
MKPIKLGYIGVGIAARDIHWPVLSRMKDKFVVSAICGRSKENLEAFSRLAGPVPCYTSYEQMLEKEDLEAIIVCTPFAMNKEIANKVLAAGKHVLVEKPIAANTSDARQMVSQAKKTVLVAMVAENWRYRPALLKAKQYIQSGAIGKSIHVSLRAFSSLDITNKYFSQSTWRLTSHIDSIMLADCGVHFFAGLRLLFGDVQKGIAHITRTCPHESHLIDSLTFTFTCQHEVNGILDYHLNSVGYSQTDLAILGEHGSIVIDENFQRLVLCSQGKKSGEYFYEDSDGIQGEFNDFYCAIREGRQYASTFAESLKDLETVEYAIETAKFWK